MMVGEHPRVTVTGLAGFLQNLHHLDAEVVQEHVGDIKEMLLQVLTPWLLSNMLFV